MRKQKLLALASAGVITAMGLASAKSYGLVIGDFEDGSLDNWSAANAFNIEPTAGIGNTSGAASLRVDIAASFNPAITRSFSGTDAQGISDRNALINATQFSIDVTTRPEDMSLIDPGLADTESWIKFENVVINGPGIGYRQLPINTPPNNAWNEFGVGADPAGPTTRHFTVSLGSIPWNLLTINPDTGAPDYLQMILITQSSSNYNSLTYYFDNIKIEQLGSVASWNVDANGNWSNGANWSTAISPNDSSTVVNFFDKITAPRTVTVNTARTVAGMNFNNTNSYTIGPNAGNSVLTLLAASGTANIDVSGGTHTISAPLTLGSPLNLSLDTGTGITISGAFNAGTYAITKSGLGVATFTNLRAGAITNIAGGLVISPKGTMNDPTGTSKVTSLQISGNQPYLDITNNALIVDYDAAASSPIAAVQNLILTGYNGGTGWVQLGLTSSNANTPVASGPFAGKQLYLGIAQTSAAGTFYGQSYDDTSLLIRLTAQGDANLDGKVDIIDLGSLAASWQGTGKYWYQGDFNYDGVVNIVDLGLLASVWQKGVGNPLGEADFATALAALGLPNVSVPEPASLGVLALGTVGLVSSRRRRNA